ncbi:MAG: DUF3048 domain-containing protein [bacterium]
MKEMQLESNVIDPKNQAPQSQPVVSPVKELKPKKPFFLKVWIEKFKLLPKKKKIIIISLSLFLIVGLSSGIIYYSILCEGRLSDLKFPEILSAIKSGNWEFCNVTHNKPDEPKSIESPINGELFTKSQWEKFSENHPIAVIIENHIAARNQSGYNSADVVFESLVEGGITRTMAIFWSNEVESLGPIRSARQYYIEWFMPYDPYFMFIGYAEGDPNNYDRRVDSGRSLYEYEIMGLNVGGSFWRVTDKVAPHNAFSSTETLYKIGENLGYDDIKLSKIEPLAFKNDSPLEDRGTATIATLRFFERLSNGGLYDVTWEYDRDTNKYYRYNGTTSYLDLNTGEQVYAKNVIIMRNEMVSTYDFKAHIIITTIGEGDATLLRDGQVINCTWKKKDLNSRIHLYDGEGEEVELNRGIIWYESVPIEEGTAHIEQ